MAIAYSQIKGLGKVIIEDDNGIEHAVELSPMKGFYIGIDYTHALRAQRLGYSEGHEHILTLARLFQREARVIQLFVQCLECRSLIVLNQIIFNFIFFD